jgi:DedD protein
MDRQLLERMIGAGVLIVALVVIVPAILDGPRDGDSGALSVPDSGAGISVETDEPTRTHTMLLDRQPDGPPVAREKTELSVTASGPPTPQSEDAASPATNPPPQASQPKPSAKDAKPATANEVTPNESPSAPTTKSVQVATADSPPMQSRQPVASAGWAVQLGSFADKQNAERLVTTVSQNGFAAYLMPLNQSGKTLYRVRVGPRDSRAQASELAERLAKAGYKGQVTQQGPES